MGSQCAHCLRALMTFQSTDTDQDPAVRSAPLHLYLPSPPLKKKAEDPLISSLSRFFVVVRARNGDINILDGKMRTPNSTSFFVFCLHFYFFFFFNTGVMCILVKVVQSWLFETWFSANCCHVHPRPSTPASLLTRCVLRNVQPLTWHGLRVAIGMLHVHLSFLLLISLCWRLHYHFPLLLIDMSFQKRASVSVRLWTSFSEMW